MGWGFGPGVPQSARDVAAAFHAGRKCNRTNCVTDGETYWLEGNAIARRVRPEDELAEVAKASSARPIAARWSSPSPVGPRR